IMKDKELDLTLDLSYNYASEKLTARTGTIKSDGMKFDISGEIVTRAQHQNLDLKIISARTSLVSFLNLIPPGLLDPLADYRITGDFDFVATLEGPITGKNIPDLNIAFNFDHGTILNPGSGFTMDKVNFTGKFSNGGKREEKFYSLELRDIKANIRGGSISGNLDIRDFRSPEVSVQLNSIMDLRELKGIYPLEYLKTIDGTLEIQMTFSNKLKDFRKFTMEDFLSSRTSGTMSFRDMNFSVKNNRLAYSNFNGTFRFSNKDLVIDAFSGKVSDSDFSMTGFLRNILPYTFRPDEKLFVQARVNSHHIHLDQLLAHNELNDDDPYNLKISDRLNFDMNVNVESFRFRKFSGQKVRGMLSQQNKMFSVREGSLHTMDGLVTLNGTIDGHNEHNYLLTCDAVLTDVDIRKLFYDFGNFGQENLTDSHLKGNVSAKVYYHSTLTPSLYVNPASVYSLADITITNGELIRYTPLFALSRYVKQEALEHIRFSTLKNNIRIENRVIFFPQMEINSNTLNLSLFGTHDFDNIMDYHFQLLLSELLVKNPKDSEPIPGIFEKETEGDKTKLFLSMTGPADNPTIRYDTKEVRKKIASDLASEKEKLTEVMKDEFRWITGRRKQEDNSSGESIYTVSGSPDFVFDWDEVKKDTITKTATQTKPQAVMPKEKKAEKDFIIRWDED
ncbi:MAG: AsmA-like C-terminal region-containing protein, partial [Bacteroidales bacterium]